MDFVNSSWEELLAGTKDLFEVYLETETDTEDTKSTEAKSDEILLTDELRFFESLNTDYHSYK